MTTFNNFDNAAELVTYLENTLVPDLRESGMECTADDFQDCAAHIEALQATCRAALHLIETPGDFSDTDSADIQSELLAAYKTE